METACFECGTVVAAGSEEGLGQTLLKHAREEHDWPYPDQGIRNYAEATQRLTGGTERLESIGEISIHRVTEDRIDDWLSFFDHDAFVGTPEWAACYCLEPHVDVRGAPPSDEAPHWRQNRAAMLERLRSDQAYGYLAYADDRPAGWVNASRRSDYTLHSSGSDDPEASEVIGVACFIVAPPYRRHSVAEALLDRVIADASSRGAQWVEGYPFNDEPESDGGRFRGPRSMFEGREFAPVETRERDTVMRRPVD